MLLRQYQHDEMVHPARVALRYVKSVCIVGPTGSGKTACIAYMCQEAVKRGKKVLVLTHKGVIQRQILRTLNDFGVKRGFVASGKKIVKEQVMVAMVGTLIHRLEAIDRPDIIITDECLDPSTEITMHDGSIKPLSWISEGDRVMTPSGNYVYVTKKWETEKEAFRFTCEDGSEIIASENHLVHGVKKGLNKAVTIPIGQAEYLTKPKRNYTSSQHIQDRMDYLYGHYIGDGCVIGGDRYPQLRFAYSEKNGDMMEKYLFKRYFKGQYERRTNIRKDSIFVFDRSFSEEFIQKYGLKSGKKSNTISINSDVYSDSNRRVDCLKGIFDSDGWTNKGATGIGTTSLNLADQVSESLIELGVKPKRLTRKRKCEKHSDLHRVYVQGTGRWYFNEAIGFRIPSKQRSLPTAAVQDVVLHKVRIVKKESMGKRKLIDIELSDDRKLFIANGLISHNCHHCTESNTWGKILRYFGVQNETEVFDGDPDMPSPINIGFTATPQGRTDGKGLHPFYREIIQGPSPQWLVSQGWLTWPKVWNVSGGVDFNMTRGDFDRKQQEDHFSSRKIFGNVIEHYRTHLDGLPTLVSCVSIKHAVETAERYEKYARDVGLSWRAVAIQGGLKYEKQMIDALNGLANGSVQIVTFCDVIGEGIDVPACMGMQMLRKTTSLILFLQFIGRILRPVFSPEFNQYTATTEERLADIANGIKPYAILLDHAGNTSKDLHGHPMLVRQWGLSDTAKGRKAGSDFDLVTTECEICMAVMPGRPQVCVNCGADLVKQALHKEGKKTPHEIEAELKEFAPELLDKVLLMQNSMTPSDRMKEMRKQIFQEGDTERSRAVAKALGYKKGFTRVIWNLKKNKFKKS